MPITRQVSLGVFQPTISWRPFWTTLLEWLSTADNLTWLQVLLTLSHKYFAHFNRSTCALSVSCHYLGLRGIHLAYSLWNQKQSYSFRIQSGLTELASKNTKCHWTITKQSRSLPNLFWKVSPRVLCKNRLSKNRGSLLTQHCTHNWGKSCPQSHKQGDSVLLGWP